MQKSIVDRLIFVEIHQNAFALTVAFTYSPLSDIPPKFSKKFGQ